MPCPYANGRIHTRLTPHLFERFGLAGDGEWVYACRQERHRRVHTAKRQRIGRLETGVSPKPRTHETIPGDRIGLSVTETHELTRGIRGAGLVEYAGDILRAVADGAMTTEQIVEARKS